LAFFKEPKRRIPINKGFKLLGDSKIPPFPYLIAEVGLEKNKVGELCIEGSRDIPC